ncbi:MAG: FAD-dependent oxidoreductase [Sphingomonadales bacterium]|nr:FAD-dependent oxidoreductase [Sphingomonadales bacterium]
MSEAETPSYDVLIVGSGHGGAQAAIQLRQMGFGGSIAMIGEETEPPYERPPLSKEYLVGEKEFARMLLRPEAFWAERDIVRLPASRVSRVDGIAKTVAASRHPEIRYDRLIWATGGLARPLPCPGADDDAVFAIRKRRDVDAIRARLDRVGRVLIVGGGYIGLEAAAGFRKLGKHVVLVEMADRVLARVAGTTLAQFYAAEHRRQGVELRLGTTVEAIERQGDGLVATLADRSAIAADLIVAGIGIVPEVGPLIAAGATGGNGVDVDSACRTSLPDVYAIGDCASHANVWADGEQIRVESVQNAHDMAKVVAADIIGEDARYEALPWFWSNQYDLKLQTVGLSIDHDAEVVRGDPASRSFSVIYLKRDRVVALDCVGRARDYVQGRKLIEARAEIDPLRLADDSIALKDMLAD